MTMGEALQIDRRKTKSELPEHYTVAQFAALTGAKPATIKARCQRGHYRLVDPKPGRHGSFLIFAGELARDLDRVPQQYLLADMLVQRPVTMGELAAALGTGASNVEKILRRLRAKGLPVATMEDLDAEPRYRILYPKGRVCAAPGCGTLLRRTNPCGYCELHGGGFLDPLSMPRRAGASYRESVCCHA